MEIIMYYRLPDMLKGVSIQLCSFQPLPEETVCYYFFNLP